MVETRETVSLCGAVDLLAAIFGENRERLRSWYGLPPVFPPCLNCEKPLRWTDKQKSGFCSARCRHEYSWITLACDECGVLFKRRRTFVIHCIGKDGYQHVFCSRRCRDKNWVRNCSFAAHHENIYHGGGPRKWDYSRIYSLRDETGWGCRRLGRILGIPEPTVGDILRKRHLLAKES